MRPQGVRITWDLVPAEVRERVAAQLGNRVVRAENQPGGFSPGAAARCVLADGRRCFIKAVSAQQNPDSPELHRQEAFVSTRLPAGLPVPKLRAVVDAEGWVVLVFDEIDGTPPPSPWTLPSLAATFVALDDLAAAATPCPVAGLPTFAERHVISFSYWRRLAEGDPVVDRVDPWSRTHLELLATLESEWEAASHGESLLHADVRADNLLVQPDGSVVLVDWPHACIGAAWVDKVCFLPSVGLDGGPSPTEVEQVLDPLAGTDFDAVNRVLAALTGYFTVEGLSPDPPGLPTVRAFQRAQGLVGRTWLAARLRVSPPSAH